MSSGRPGFSVVRREDVADVRLSRPPANTLDIETLEALSRQISGLATPLRALVLSGDSHFCAGVAIGESEEAYRRLSGSPGLAASVAAQLARPRK